MVVFFLIYIRFECPLVKWLMQFLFCWQLVFIFHRMQWFIAYFWNILNDNNFHFRIEMHIEFVLSGRLSCSYRHQFKMNFSGDQYYQNATNVATFCSSDQSPIDSINLVDFVEEMHKKVNFEHQFIWMFWRNWDNQRKIWHSSHCAEKFIYS